MSLAECFVIFLVTVIVFGPKRLPELAAQLGRCLSKINRLKQQGYLIWQQYAAQQALGENQRKAEEADQQYQTLSQQRHE